MWLTPIKLRRDGSYPLWRRLFDDFFETPHTAFREGNGHSLVPALDLRETDTSVVVETELPGVDSKDVTLQMEGDVLSIRGERRHEKEDKGGTTYCQDLKAALDYDEKEADKRAGTKEAKPFADEADFLWAQGVKAGCSWAA